MKILSLRDKKSPTPELMKQLLAEHGVEVIDHSPALLSAFAAMRIASIIDKENIEAIEAHGLKDAMAALSARKLARKNNVRVIMNVAPDSEPPKSVTADVRHGVDAWIFPGERLRMAYSEDINNAVVIPTTSFNHPIDIARIEEERREGTQPPVPVLSWIGNIDRPERLKAFFEEAEAIQGDLRLRVCGAGKAAIVMPVVRFSRHLARNKDIQWAGEDYDVVKEIAGSDALLATNDDITEIEAAAILSGRPLLQPGDVAAFLEGRHMPRPEVLNPRENVCRYLDVMYNPV